MVTVVALLATVVAGMYLYIAFVVVPRLVHRAGGRGGRALPIVRWGAVAFFSGCAATHLGTALAVAGVLPAAPAGEAMHGTAAAHDPATMLWFHLLPHVAQLVGGAVFIVTAHRRVSLVVIERTEAERLREEHVQLKAAFDLAPLGIALSSVAPGGGPGRLLQVNAAVARMVKLPAEQLVGRSYLDFVAPEHHGASERARTALEGQGDTTRFEQEVVDADGERIWTTVHGSLVRDEAGQPRFVVAQIYDVTQDRRREAELRRLADHDPLTGLLNRRRLEEEIGAVLSGGTGGTGGAGGTGGSSALLLLDLDQFRFVNDSHGHAVGDAVLVAVAETVQRHLSGQDLVGRLGGDSFGVLCSPASVDRARALADELAHAVRDEVDVTVGARRVRVDTSVGIAMLPGDGSLTTEQVLSGATLAMYELKHDSRGRVALLTEDGDLAGVRSLLSWSDKVREALAQGAFDLWEQPIVDLTTGLVARSELLIRMVDPADGTVVPPGRFLPAAERFGQITSIDRWVFRQAVALLAVRQRAGDDRRLEVNLSGQSLTDTDLIDELVDLVAGSGIDPTRLMVEVTETSAVRNFDTAREVSRRLADLGCSFVLDDFGAGFGSFSYLKHLPFDGIKIDGEFIKDLPRSPTDQLTVHAMATLAGGLGKELTAEFVQDDETIDILRRLGVGFAQGYHLGRPHRVRELPRPRTPHDLPDADASPQGEGLARSSVD